MDLSQFSALLNKKLFTISGTPLTPATIATILIIILASFFLSKLVGRAIDRGMRNRGVHQQGSIAAFSRLLQYMILFGGLGVALETAGISLAALFTAGAVFAVGIGFAMQNIAQNFVSGVILLVERAIKPGDVLFVENTIVRVAHMGIRSAVVRTRDGEDLIVPNSTLVQSAVKNYTLNDGVVRVRAKVGVVYGSDMNLVLQTLNEVAEFASPKPETLPSQVILLNFGDSSVNFEVAVWIEDPWTSRVFLGQLNKLIWDALKEQGITIAFPQLDVHFDTEVMRALPKVLGAQGT